jgi:pimeloyl-ACP methyl ester carboxylesterase
MMKPMSLVYAAAGNPLGQATWILERFHDWSDLSQGDLDSVYGLDHLITNIMLYVMNDSFQSSIWFYNGLLREGRLELSAGTKCTVPLGIAAFPGDALLPVPPRSRVELVASDLMHWTDMPSGGHFAAMEKPELFAADVAAWGAKVWPDA